MVLGHGGSILIFLLHRKAVVPLCPVILTLAAGLFISSSAWHRPSCAVLWWAMGHQWKMYQGAADFAARIKKGLCWQHRKGERIAHIRGESMVLAGVKWHRSPSPLTISKSNCECHRESLAVYNLGVCQLGNEYIVAVPLVIVPTFFALLSL